MEKVVLGRLMVAFRSRLAKSIFYRGIPFIIGVMLCRIVQKRQRGTMDGRIANGGGRLPRSVTDAVGRSLAAIR
jgi:hypothetical protein